MSRGPYVRAMADGGPGRVEHYPPGTAFASVRRPVVVRCTEEDCPSALAMPPGTPADAQRLRLEVAGWTGGMASPVCGVDHSPAPEPGPVTPTWARWALLVGLWLILLSALTAAVIALGGTPPEYVLAGALLTGVTFGFGWLRWRRR